MNRAFPAPAVDSPCAPAPAEASCTLPLTLYTKDTARALGLHPPTFHSLTLALIQQLV